MVNYRNNTRIILVMLLFVILLICRFRIVQYKELLTLKEAISLASVEAHRWSVDASLVYAVSIDTDEKVREDPCGKRNSWNLVFLNQRSQHDVLVAVRNGRIAYVQEVLMVYRNCIIPERMRLDSGAALKIIKQLGTIKSPTVYRYELFCLNKTYLRLYCLDADGHRSIITFDENTGRLCR